MIEQVTLDLLQLAMDIKQTEHKAAAANVASANIPGSQKMTVDFSSLMQSLAGADDSHKAEIIQNVREHWQSVEQSATETVAGKQIKLDEESAQLLLASGKYKLLAEGLSRKFGLMQVAVAGGKR